MKDIKINVLKLILKIKDYYIRLSRNKKRWMQFLLLKISALPMLDDYKELENKGNLIMKDLCDLLNASYASLEMTADGYGFLPKAFQCQKQVSGSGKRWRKSVENINFSKELMFDNKVIGRITLNDCSSKRLLYRNGDGVRILLDSLTRLILRLHENEKLYFMAYFDHLTMLPNRILFMEKAREAIIASREANEMAALLFLDLDAFKYINDTFGHDGGDELLKCTASRLRSYEMRCCTTSRFGGDEYVILLPHLADKEEAEKAADSLLGIIQEPFYIGNEWVSITASIGIALFPDHGDSVEELLKRADQAMYTAKVRGKGRYAVFEIDIENNGISSAYL